MTVIDLAALNAVQGITIFGADAGDSSGRSVSNAGDVNGDGFDDLIIGAVYADALGSTKSDAGDSYVIFGNSSFAGTMDLANLGSAGLTISGADVYDLSGFSASGAGDLNGDGFDDLVIGARFADALGNAKTYAGDSYVIFGDASLPATIDLANLGTDGITIFGADIGDLSGFSVSSAGDINGDGFDDLIIGAAYADALGNTRSNAGESYVVFGAASLPAAIDLANLGTDGITIFGADIGDISGFSVSSAGDINGDGFDELLIGARYGDAMGNGRYSSGESYVIFGAAAFPTTIDLANLGSAGTTIFGAEAGDQSALVVSNAGDVNGDGFDDLMIGARLANALSNTKQFAGDSYVVFGAASRPATIDLANLGSAGITIFGADVNDRSGFALSGAGDVNGDGFDDLLIGGYLADALNNLKSDAGDSYVIFGAASLPTTIDLANIASAGITISGAESNDRSGFALSSAGDINGDGFDDLLIGARYASASGNGKPGAGDSYVIFGGNGFTNSITAGNLGGASGDALLGDSTANRINGAGGDDIVSSGGGADVLLGGQGNDTLVINDASFQRIMGGTGNDSLLLNNPTDVGFTLDLTAIPDNRLQEVEAIDITGFNANNTLTLNHREVLNLSRSSNTLIVRRNAGDIVNIGTGWTFVNTELIGPSSFHVFAQGQARLKVQVAAQASAANRQFFYNNASGFGTSGVNNAPTVNPINAIDPTKQALLPGAQTTTAANYTNYSRGLNGIVFDLNNPGNLSGISSGSFLFAIWNNFANGTPNFVAINPTVTVSNFPAGGTAGSDRVKLVFADRAIENAWLRITVLADANTGLAASDVFYFGNARFDVTPTSPFPSQQVTINIFDTNAIRAKQGQNSGLISNVFDVDRNGVVNIFDTNAVRAGQGVSSLRSFTAPALLSPSSVFAPTVSIKKSSKLSSRSADVFYAEFGIL